MPSLVEIGLTDPPKKGEGHVPPKPPTLFYTCCNKYIIFGPYCTKNFFNFAKVCIPFLRISFPCFHGQNKYESEVLFVNPFCGEQGLFTTYFTIEYVVIDYY